MEIFHEYALKKNEPVCGNFLNLLNAADGFINNMSARIIAKFACYSTDLINQTDLQFYLNWIKEQLLSAVRQYFKTNMKKCILLTGLGCCEIFVNNLLLLYKHLAFINLLLTKLNLHLKYLESIYIYSMYSIIFKNLAYN